MTLTIRPSLTQKLQESGKFEYVFVRVSDDGGQVELLSTGPKDDAYKLSIYNGSTKYSRVSVSCDVKVCKQILGKELASRFYEMSSMNEESVTFMAREITHPVIGG